MASQLCADEPAKYDRLAEVKAFDDTKAGVKGLLDAGLTSVPRMFISPREDRAEIHLHADPAAAPLQVPIIDLSSAAATEGVGRREAIDQIRRVSETWGFFQVVGHGVPLPVLGEMVAGVRRFHEGDAAEKAAFYCRDPARKVKFASNLNLYQAPIADWRDTLCCSMAPDAPASDEIPATCREIVVEYTRHAARLAETLLELLSESLGLRPSRLKDMGCDKGLTMLCHYYPQCPAPDLTLGGSGHADASFLTILLQDDVGGLQAVHQGRWVDVPPVPGALVVILGDPMQLITNDRFKSVEHRVLVNRGSPRVSVGCFFTPPPSQYGTAPCSPMEELLSEDDPPKYRGMLFSEYMRYFYAKGRAWESPLSHFKL